MDTPFQERRRDGYAYHRGRPSLGRSFRAEEGRGLCPIRRARRVRPEPSRRAARVPRTITNRCRTALPHKTAKRIATSGGRGSNSDWPYFNLEWPGEGVIAVVGWPGQWAASFTRDEANGLRVRAGQEQTHFKLLPGEEVRTPLVVLQFWKGDRIRSQNILRRWMLAHNVPKPGGKPIQPMLFGCSSHFTSEMVDANEANQMQFIDRYLEERLKIDYWWMDAGWYLLRRQLAARPAPGKSIPSVSPRPAGHQRPRACQGHQDHRLVRARAGSPRHVAYRKTSRMDPGREERRPAEPRQPRGSRMADRPRRAS